MNKSLSLLALCLLSLAGCNRAGVSGAGSMRVEIEVYKGPLTQSPQAQIGELSALMAETVKAARDWRRQAARLAATPELSCNQAMPDNPSCTAISQAIGGADDIVAALCRVAPPDPKAIAAGYQVDSYPYHTDGLTRWRDACDDQRTDINAGSKLRLADTQVGSELTTPAIVERYDDFARRVSTIAATMRIKAFRITDSNVGYVPSDPKVRNMTAGYAYMMAELANMMATRTSILQKTLDSCLSPDAADGSKENKASEITYDSRKMTDACRFATDKFPTSDFLRDVAPTRFIDAYDWFDASISSDGTGAYKQEDRVRAVKALTNDYHWEKVNEVYASGQGDVSMAFIKDELGNWNLKSYTNDPSELLAAYRKGANALISAAVSAARKASGDPTQVAKGIGLLDLADRMATGKSPADTSLGGLNLDNLHKRTETRLLSLRARYSERQTSLADEIPSAEAGVTKAEATATADAAALAQARDQQTRDDAALQSCTDNCASAAASAVGSRNKVATYAATAAASSQLLRSEQDKLAVLKAESDGMGAAAAEQAQTILEEHQHDLMALQAAVAPAAREKNP